MINEKNEINGIKNDLRLESQKIIEECMIIANVASSLFIKKIRLQPYTEYMMSQHSQNRGGFNSSKNIGYNLSKTKIPCSEEINMLIKLSKKKLDDHLVTSILLRSMARAEYNPKNLGHYGLALKII